MNQANSDNMAPDSIKNTQSQKEPQEIKETPQGYTEKNGAPEEQGGASEKKNDAEKITDGMDGFFKESEGLLEDLYIPKESVPVTLLSSLLQVPYGTLRGFIEREEVSVDEEESRLSIFLDDAFREALEEYNPRKETLVEKDSFRYEALQSVVSRLNGFDSKMPTLSCKEAELIYGVPAKYLKEQIKCYEENRNKDISENSDEYLHVYGESYATDDQEKAIKQYEDEEVRPDDLVLVISDELFENLITIIDQYQYVPEDREYKFECSEIEDDQISLTEDASISTFTNRHKAIAVTLTIGFLILLLVAIHYASPLLGSVSITGFIGSAIYFHLKE